MTRASWQGGDPTTPPHVGSGRTQGMEQRKGVLQEHEEEGKHTFSDSGKMGGGQVNKKKYVLHFTTVRARVHQKGQGKNRASVHVKAP